MEFYIVPDFVPKNNISPSRFCSSLINSELFSLFSSWIDKKDSSHYNKKDRPHNFKLLYTSSNQDKFDAKSFHENCDNKGATIWVAKIQDSTQLIGGYNPLDWNGDCGWKSTADSFIFNFNDGEYSSAKFGYVEDIGHAVYCDLETGPRMGNLHLHTNNRTSHRCEKAYPELGIPSNFVADTIEVFQVLAIKK